MFASPGTIKASSCFLWGIVAVPESLVLPIERISKNTSFVRIVIFWISGSCVNPLRMKERIFLGGVARFRICVGSGRRAASRLFRL